MAKFSIAYYAYPIEDEFVLTYENNLNHTLIGDYWEYMKEIRLSTPCPEGEQPLFFGINRTKLTDLLKKIEDVLRIPQKNSNRLSQIYEWLPFVKEKWDVEGNSFNEELWFASEFLADVLKTRSDIFLKTKKEALASQKR